MDKTTGEIILVSTNGNRNSNKAHFLHQLQNTNNNNRKKKSQANQIDANVYHESVNLIRN